MPGEDAFRQLEKRLRACIKVVLRHAKSNEEFSRDLFEALEIDEPAESSSVAIPRDEFNPVSFLRECNRNEQPLRDVLDKNSQTELMTILKRTTTISNKELKALERTELIEQIIFHAVNALNQGAAFLGASSRIDSVKTDDSPPTPASTEAGAN